MNIINKEFETDKFTNIYGNKNKIRWSYIANIFNSCTKQDS